MDLQMPRMNGAELLSRVRSRWASQPVILLTAYPDSTLVMRALDASPITLLSKTASSNQLLAAVMEAVDSPVRTHCVAGLQHHATERLKKTT